MAGDEKNKKALHMGISSIFADLGMIKKTGTQQQSTVPTSTPEGHVGRKPPTVAQLLVLQAGPGCHGGSQLKTIRPVQSRFAPSTSGTRRVLRHAFPSRSRREERRLRSISKHLLINLQD